MSKIDPDAYYAYAYRGGRDADEHLSVVPRHVFDVLKDHEAELDAGSVPSEAQWAVDFFLGCSDVSGSFSEEDLEEVADDRWVRMTLT